MAYLTMGMGWDGIGRVIEEEGCMAREGWGVGWLGEGEGEGEGQSESGVD